jgi:hypothetical protein
MMHFIIIDEVMKNFRLDGAFHGLRSSAIEVTDFSTSPRAIHAKQDSYQNMG